MFTKTSLREERAGCIEVTFFLAKPVTDAELHSQQVKAAHKAHPELPPNEKAEPQLTLEENSFHHQARALERVNARGLR
jgi:hypothetical protein